MQPASIACSSCRSRPASYYRASSGERLCRACLERSLARIVKDTLARLAGLTPRDHIVVPVDAALRNRTLAMLRLLGLVEKQYPSTLSVVFLYEPSPGDLELARSLDPKGSGLYVASIDPRPGKPRSLLERLRLLRALGGGAARRLGANVVVLPLLRDELSKLMLAELLKGSVEGVLEHRPSFRRGNLKYVYPLYRVSSEDLAFYTHMLGLEPGEVCSDALEADVGGLLLRLFSESRELSYSMPKSAEFLREAAGGGESCSVCGAEGGAPICGVCSRLGLGEAVRTLNVRSASSESP